MPTRVTKPETRFDTWVALVMLGAIGACTLNPLDVPAPVANGGAAGVTSSGGSDPTGGAGGASSGGAGAQGGTGADDLHPAGFTHRMEIFIEAESALAAGHAVSVELDHEALVSAGTSREDGRDLRLFYAVGNGWEERTRVLDPSSSWNSSTTILWFALTNDLAGDKKERQFYLYYGGGQSSDPPDDPNDVYAFWGFDVPLDDSWTSEAIGAGTLSVDLTGGLAKLTVQSGAIGNVADDFGFLHRQVTGDFVIDAHQVAAGGSFGASATLGGTMVRRSVDPASRHTVSSIPSVGEQDFSLIHRAAEGAAASTTMTTLPASMPGYSRLIRLGDNVSAHGSSDAQHWHPIGEPVTFDEALGEDVRVGIALAADAVTTAWVEVDWLRIRPAVPQEPMVYVKPEQGPL